MTFDWQQTLTFSAMEQSDIGDHIITVQASLRDFPSVSPVQSDITVTIEGCIVQSLSFIPPEKEYTYDIHLSEQPLIFSYAEFTQEPDCNYPVDYEIANKWLNFGYYSELPEFFQLREEEKQFIIETSDVFDVGQYYVSIRGSVSDQYQN